MSVFCQQMTNVKIRVCQHWERLLLPCHLVSARVMYHCSSRHEIELRR